MYVGAKRDGMIWFSVRTGMDVWFEVWKTRFGVRTGGRACGGGFSGGGRLDVRYSVGPGKGCCTTHMDLGFRDICLDLRASEGYISHPRT